jgi:hypothetical protein
MYWYKEILSSYKKEWSIDTCCNMNEPQHHSAKWKKLRQKGHTLYDSIYAKCPE